MIKIYVLMKIVLDPQIFNNQSYGGISRYYVEVFSILSTKQDVKVIVPLLLTNNVYFNHSKLITKKQKQSNLLIKIFRFLRISIRSKVRKSSLAYCIKTIKTQDFDLFVPTYYDPYFLDSIGLTPFVLTVYDMTHELLPQYFFNDKQNVVKNKLLLMERATKIIAVSENTKKDIIRLYPQINSDKIQVIYHGCSIDFNPKIKVDLPTKYILFVGARDGYKNFLLLIDALKNILLEDLSLFLVCAGGGDFSIEEKDIIFKLGLKNKIICRQFKEVELGTYYKNAICFVFPSMYEGFGIPILEAMACGCPIILSDSSSFPEVAGEAGIYFKNNDSVDLETKILKVIKNSDFREEYSLKGLLRVKEFSWKIAAEKCYELYEEAITIKK